MKLQNTQGTSTLSAGDFLDILLNLGSFRARFKTLDSKAPLMAVRLNITDKDIENQLIHKQKPVSIYPPA